MVGCSTCGRELTYIAQYDRHYCYSCRAYAPKDVKPCPQCNRALVYVPQYQRYYCYGCQEYKQVTPVAAQPAQASNPCPTCGRELSFIQQYNRYYCYNCKAYAPVRKDMPSGAPAAGVGGMVTPPVLRAAPTPATAPATSSPPAATAPAMPQTPQPQGTPRGEAKVPGGKAALFSRQDLDGASKDQLMRWCQDYGLDASGMKYELRLRIMEYMRSHGLDFREGEGPSAAAEVRPGPSAAEMGRPEGSDIVIEAIEDGEEEDLEGPDATALVTATPHPTPRPTPQPVAPGALQSGGTPVAQVRPEAPATVQPVTPLAQASPRLGSPTQAAPAARAESLQRMGCPTCGGPLSYIAQYDRHYCYRCRAYAPRQTTSAAVSAATAYPSAGLAQGYPGYAMAPNVTYPQAAYQTQRPQVLPQTQGMPQAIFTQRTGGNIMMGVYLMLLGLALYGVYEFLVNFPPDLNFGTAVVPPAVGFALRFLGLFFIVIGAMLGLILVYQRFEAKV